MPEYAAQKNVQILVALLKEHGVRHAVLSPGSRNMALVRSLETDPYFTCFSVVDERSAAYFGVGVSVAKGEPVLLSCTSAQATRNYIPGMTEAYYRGIPLVVVTADYDQSMIMQGNMQTVDQMSIPRDAAKCSVRLPTVVNANQEWYCTRLVNEALLELNHHGTGPVHIDLPIEEHWVGGVKSLPTVRKASRFTDTKSLPDIAGRRIMVGVGEHAVFTEPQREALDAFSRRYDAVVFTHHLSNYHGPRSVKASLLLSQMDRAVFPQYSPDLLITIGGQMGDYGFDGRFKQSSIEHWRVNPDGMLLDTFGNLTAVFEMEEADFFAEYAGIPGDAPEPLYFGLWAKANAKRTIPDDLPLSHALVAATLSPMIPANSVVHFAILSSLRNWNFFELDSSVEAYSNVAAFGIDGCMSTFVGHSAATEQLCFLVIGDLSFFYDMNSIGIRHVGPNARIVMVNNAGGGEFRLYQHAADQYFGDEANTHIAASGHNGSARGWVESLGWHYVEVQTTDDLVSNARLLVGESDRPVFFEVFTTMADDSQGVELIRKANTIENLQRTLERTVGKMLTPGMRRLAKRALGRS